MSLFYLDAQKLNSGYQQLKSSPAPIPSSSRSSSSTADSRQRSPRKARQATPSKRNLDIVHRLLSPSSDIFEMKNGAKHHSYHRGQVPYPLSYDSGVIDLDSIDEITGGLRGERFNCIPPEQQPKKALDLGCGTGIWAFEAAKYWKNTSFVGFDLMPIQTNPAHVPYIQGRVKWVHGNFLTSSLPFADDTFDFVHARSIGMAVPEDKWDFVISEVERVLKPGGIVELIVDDILFPYIPLPAVPKTTLGVRNPRKSAGSSTIPRPPSVIPPSIALSPMNTLTPRAHQALTHSELDLEFEGDSEGFQTRRSGVFPPSVRSTSEAFNKGVSISPSTQALRTPWPNSQSARSSIADVTSSTRFSQAFKAPPAPLDLHPRRTLAYELDQPRHAHEWLAELFYSVWERRFINLNPTSMLANVLNMYFTKVNVSPKLEFPLPPEGGTLAHLDRKPADKDNLQNRSRASSSASTSSPLLSVPPLSRSAAGSFSSLDTHVVTPQTPPSSLHPSPATPKSSPTFLEVQPEILGASMDSMLLHRSTQPSISIADTPPSKPAPTNLTTESFAIAPFLISDTQVLKPPLGTSLPHNSTGIFNRPGTSTDQASSLPPHQESFSQSVELPASRKAIAETMYKSGGSLAGLISGADILALQLYRAFQLVVGCKEAMWEELLEQRGWTNITGMDGKESHEKLMKERRAFDVAMENYVVDMQSRIVMSEGLVHLLGWTRPKTALTPAQKLDESRRNILRAPRSPPKESADSLMDWDDDDSFKTATMPTHTPNALYGASTPTLSNRLEELKDFVGSLVNREELGSSEEKNVFRSIRIFTATKARS